MSVLLGAIADDFTGATDLANTLVSEGMPTIQMLGVPESNAVPDGASAVVISLKTRTKPPREATRQALEALEWLRAQGARQTMFKYCSTFDSTDRGNIGPVADALLDALGGEFALVCPAFPENGRTVYNGMLFVGDTPLSESPMKDHPITPMRDSSLRRLLEAQSRHQAGLIPLQAVRCGAAAVRSEMLALRAAGVTYGVADALTDGDLRVLAEAAVDNELITGGSGIARGLPENFHMAGALRVRSSPSRPRVCGRRLVLAGSCTPTTRTQISWAKEHWPCRKIEIERLGDPEDEVNSAIAWAASQPEGAPVVLYGSDDREEVARGQARFGAFRAGEMMEAAMGRIAVALHEIGFRQLVVAGGETSASVVSALGPHALRIGPEIAPGIPWTEALGTPPLALALKSGNFGAESFFAHAFEMLD
ncbi:MAG: 3-oxo-tetronate kinase [Pseudomonadota bacterium]